MIQDLIKELETAKSPSQRQTVITDAADYLRCLLSLQRALLHLHSTASESLVNDTLDEATKGHRLGTIEMCDAMLKLF